MFKRRTGGWFVAGVGLLAGSYGCSWEAEPTLDSQSVNSVAALQQPLTVSTPAQTRGNNEPLGKACADPSECASGFCVDGVCCDQACNAGPCDTCLEAEGAPSDGTCQLLTGPSCDDGSACTQSDTCQAGECVGGDPVVCAPQDECHEAGVCDPATGLCTTQVKADGTSCDDGNPCTESDTCQAGACVGGSPVVCAAQDECHDVGVCDPATGLCTNPAKPDGSPCDDGNACTQLDTCQAGACEGSNPVVCTALDQCHDAGECNPATGLCSNPVKPDGSSCDDNNACTQSDSCQAGTCMGSNPVVCAALDQCHDVGVCDPATGLCNNPAKPDGSSCDDNNACTQSDSCQAGACMGSDPVVCAALDQCHDVGVCDPATGLCNNPAKPDGSSCDDDNACTQLDTCQSGECVGSNPVVCTALDQCHEAGSCDPTTGACSNPTKADGSSCDDDNACTQLDTCQSGECVGSNPVVCTALDECHLAGQCDPATGLCSQPAKPDGQPCTDDDNPCTVDQCQAGACVHPAGNAGALCRSAQGMCDLPDYCDGVSTTCEDAKRSNSEVCRSSAGICDVADTCDGVSNDCPEAFASAGTPCRAASCAAGTATQAATCTGTAATCPDPVTVACAPYVCGPTACATECTSNTECSTGHFCSGNVCVPKYPNGQACSSADVCASGHCIDGVCCNAACTGQCEACDVAGKIGVCSAVTGEPHGSRPDCLGDGSACHGSCNGVQTQACTYPGASTQCRAPSCAAGTATLAAYCNGNGSCPAPQTQPCAPYQCGATQCEGDCHTDPSCLPGNYCSAGVCTPKRPNGSVCGAPNQCQSGHCVDGYCCNEQCAGQCEACDVSGSEGTCSAVTGNPHGGRLPCMSDGSVCGGSCDGVHADTCVFPGSSVECRAPSCSDGTAVLAAYCDGTGRCPEAQSQVCAPYGCGGATCAGNCQFDSDCLYGHFCSGGVCAEMLEVGEPCGGDGQCFSGYCVDGYCCNSSCAGQCEACDVPGMPGNCFPVTGAPHGNRPACASDGSVCGGACDGLWGQGCAYPGNMVSCRQPSCTDGIAYLEAFCDSAGACPTPQTQDCAPYLCGETQCDGDCANDTNCDPVNYCSGGVCTPRLALGQACGGDNQCSSGHCVDGVCCDSTCEDQCEACDVAGSEGTCTAVTGAPHGGRPACAGTGVCQGTCDGEQRTACVHPGEETVCAEPACADGVETTAGTCDGTGACQDGQQRSCGAYACGADGCLTSCSGPDDCASGVPCVNSVCGTEPDGGADASPADASNDTSSAEAGSDAALDAEGPSDSGSQQAPSTGESEDAGCGCAVPRSTSAGSWAWLGLVLAGLLRRRK